MSTNPKRHAVTAIVLALFAAAFSMRAVPEPSNNFHVAFLGDRTGGAQPQVFGRVLREIDMLHPDFMINVGDSIEGRRDDATVEQQWSEFQTIWKRYKHFPLYFTAGNHDIWSPFSEKVYIRETKFQPNYSFDYQDAHFTVLDNSRTAHLDDQQLRFLEQDLQANRNRSPKFVLFHRPYWIEMIKQHGTDFPLHQIVKRYGVSHVISGHGHQFVRIVRDGIAYMEVGSSGGTMNGKLIRGEGFAQGCFYHFVWCHVEGNNVYLTVKEIDGSLGRGRMFRAEDWDENGPHFDTGDPAITARPET
ncbi:MAG: metallophosphoesterase [Bryobacterales bacterium]|nr:metallophosphoesterase [Bryobacterales bacterium]